MSSKEVEGREHFFTSFCLASMRVRLFVGVQLALELVRLVAAGEITPVIAGKEAHKSDISSTSVY
jgi:hypothetical protein